MAHAHPTPVVTTGIRFGHGSTPDPWRGDVDALKREIDDLRATVGSLVKEIEELKKVKTEAVSGVLPSYRQHTCRLLLFARNIVDPPYPTVSPFSIVGYGYAFCHAIAHDLTSFVPS